MPRDKEKLHVWQKQHRKDHPEYYKEKEKKRYWKHRMKRLSGNKIWRGKNKEYVKIKYAEWKKNNDEYLKEYFKKYNKDVRDPLEVKAYNRRYCLLKKYDLTMEEYEKILESQGGVCAICGQPPKDGKNLSVDHDHKLAIILKKEGKSIKESVRGLLDYNCNRRLMSNLADRDNAVELFESALKYIKNHKEKNSTYLDKKSRE